MIEMKFSAKMVFAARDRNAFTLVELLAVMCVIAILTAVTVPSILGTTSAGNMNRAVDGISTLLEQARTYAMAHNTYVWVGFQPSATTPQLTVGVVAGATGEIDDLASSTYIPITNPRVYSYFSLATLTGVPGMAANGDNITSSQIGSFSETSAGSTVTFADVLQFSPQGVATILPDSSSHWIQIGLQPSHGTPSSNPNVAVFQVATLTGQVQVFRP